MNQTRELLPTAHRREAIRFLARLVRPRWALGAGSMAALTAGTIAGLAIPALIGHIVDLIDDGHPPEDLTWPIVLIAIATVSQGVLSLAGDVLTARFGESTLADLRERVVHRALRLDLNQVERAGTGDIISRVSGDVSIIAEAVREVLPAMTKSGLIIGLTIVGLAAMDWRFALAGLCAAPIQGYTLFWYLRKSAPVYAAERIAEGERAHQLLDSFDGAPTVRAFNLADSHVGHVRDSSASAMAFNLRAVVLRTRFFARLNLAEFIGMATILTTGFLLVRSDATSIGAVTAAALYFHRIFDPVNVFLALFDEAQMAGAGLTRLIGIADLPEAPPSGREPAKGPTSIRLEGVRFAYEARHTVLHDIDLEVREGERVALVGASGAGKSTVAKLISGIHAPESGSIRLAGVDAQELGEEGVKQVVVLVAQEVHVFAGTLAEDLRLARPSASDADLLAALDRVGASAWLSTLADGLETAVGDGGHALTTTQAQQLALARLILKDPPVALLDEATAEAGSAGARALEASAEAALEGRTGLVIAHRLTQAASADRVVVLDHGRVIEDGTHEELIARGSLYANLWRAWSAGRA